MTTLIAPAEFDLCGPLPSGTTVLEASAGTGKTFTIAALTTRYVAEGVAELSELMLVTFGNAASRELRDRVREHLVSAEAALRDPRAALTSDNEVIRWLAAGPATEVAARHERLARALAGFDAATIATTHSFCAQMLAGLGLAADADPDALFTEGVDDLVREIANDLYLKKFGLPDSPPARLRDSDLLLLGQKATGSDRSATLWPLDAPGLPGQRKAAAQAIRRELEKRKQRLGLVDYDDWLVLLRSALDNPEHGAIARERVRSRYRVVMVDEFQDTDPVQWDVLRLAFHGFTTLVLIGDPKQAIYAFRGGDVTTYLAAASLGDSQATLARNWRSDKGLLAALEHLFAGAALGDERIVVRPVGNVHELPRLSGSGAPLRLRRLTRSGYGRLSRSEPRVPGVGRLRSAIAADVAADIAGLVTGVARLRDRPDRPARPVHPGDVAVLIRYNSQGPLIRDALQAVGVPAVLAGGGTVFATPSARSWLVLLEAMEQPHRQGRVRAAALGVFLGYDEVRLDGRAGDAITDDLAATLRGWGQRLSDQGVAAFFETLNAAERLPARLLGRPDGERIITDLRHIAESLHRAAHDESLGLTALVEWLRRRISQAAAEGTDERSRRLESDAAAVQIMTVHGSKGLEFPVVYVPFGWDRTDSDEPELLRLHDDAGNRVLDVGGPGSPGYAEARQRHDAEESGEELRLLYVALTRAKCQVVAHWAPSMKTPTSPLHRLIFGRNGPGRLPTGRVVVPSDDEVELRLEQLAGSSAGTVSSELLQIAEASVAAPRGDRVGSLGVSTFTRSLDADWRRTSYSALTAAAHELTGVASEPDDAAKDDEVDVELDLLQSPPDDSPLSPLADFPGGTTFGTLVHEILEETDPRQLADRAREAVGNRLGTIDPVALAEGLRPVLLTPLGSLGVTLADLGPRDRLAELNFEFPLAGGDAAGGAAGATLADVAALLARHDLGTLSAYPALLAQLDPAVLRGYLSGSIDAVLRLPGPRYVVVDYKTNRLGRDPLTAWHYRPEAMAEEMLRAHYVLQALLYCVALHRFLRWRQPGYDPGGHLGPVLYLFVRGMCGPESPSGAGVFEWQPPPALILELSDLLAGAR